MSEEITNKKFSWQEKLLYFAAATLLPNIFLFNLYSNNYEDAHILLGHVFILTVILVMGSMIGLLLSRFIVHSYEGALLLLLFFWVFFWTFETFYSRLPAFLTELSADHSKNLFLFFMLSVFFGCACVLRLLKIKFYKVRALFSALAGVICLMFVFNAVPPVFANVTAPRMEDRAEQVDFYIRHDFNVDSSLPSPDIYWLHMDGMINFSSMAFLFDDTQDELRQQLLDRGFVINEEAELAAHNTVFGVPALLSPAFYDSYLGELLTHTNTLLRRGRQRFLHGALNDDGISLAEDVAPYHELLHAFLAVDYTAVMIADFSETVYVPIDHFYRIGNAERHDDTPLTIGNITEIERHVLSDAIDLLELLTLATPVPYRFVIQIREGQFDWESIPEYAEEIDRLTEGTSDLPHERQLYRRLMDSFSIEGPRLVYMPLMFTHAARWNWHYDELVGHGAHSYRIDLYPTAHEYAANVMLTMIDLILEENPNAVIVIQSDHGFHLHATQAQLLADGFTELEVAQIQNSVMSAVRIPEQYGGLDEALDPRNITRELVNRFVGPNYELLSE
ncbi:MAG: hypothetical protein FWE07_02500 [Turicibacter sp.]|nr:hypothetical protein [Turicibacter sp.]